MISSPLESLKHKIYSNICSELPNRKDSLLNWVNAKLKKHISNKPKRRNAPSYSKKSWELSYNKYTEIIRILKDLDSFELFSMINEQKKLREYNIKTKTTSK